ncbi:MAG: Flp pilus assembly complex ATPase component TadA [Candidatus Pacebacteria bacterium]|nr:Flp pilus assembly complex ATPase component TadA [Candidatus Paceibacterota bacterium]
MLYNISVFIDKNKVADLILETGLINREDFDLARAEADNKGVSVCDILVRQGKMSEDERRDVQMKVYGASFVNLRKRKIAKDILFIIPEPLARRYGVIAFERDEKNLKVAILNLDNLEKIDFLRKKAGLRIIPRLTDRASFSGALLRYQELLRDEYGAAIQKEFLSFQTISGESLAELPREKLLELARDKRINFVFELLLRHALTQGASNIHIEPRRDDTLIRYRIGGVLYPAMALPKNAAVILALKIKALSGLGRGAVLSKRKIEEDPLEIRPDGRFQLGFDGKGANFQARSVPSFWGERIVLNILREGDSGFSLENLGFHGRGLDVPRALMDKKEKLVLIAGKKQSGRTTTFYTFLDLLKSPGLSIATLEDSIGFQMLGISQTATNPEIGFNISNGVRRLAKQDIDVLAVDEIDNLNALSCSIDIANEDKFVFSVLETEENSTAKIIAKLGSAQLSSPSIAFGLGAVILQKLLPKLSARNRREHYLSVSEIKRLSKQADLEKVMDALVEERVLAEKTPWSKMLFYKSVIEKDNPPQADASSSAKATEDRQGKIMVSEVLKISPMIKELILKNETAEKIERQARQEGMLTLTEDMVFKAVQGLVSLDEIL